MLKRNFIYNILYQILILILPLITVPYVSRVLGAYQIGAYSYTYSVIYYFMLIALLGINNYGNRTVAKVRDDKTVLSKTFFEIYFIQFLCSLLMIVCYIIYIALFAAEFRLIATLQVFHLVATIFDINWFFFGLEKFKVTVTRNTLLKILSLILIFIFVKDANDLWIYTLILSGSTLLSQLLLLPFLKKEIVFVKIKMKDVLKHLKACIVLFVPVISVSLYKVMDKIMLGILANVEEVGFYEQAEKIINIPMGIVTALGTVMLPRISNLVEKKDKKSVLNYIKKSISFIMFLAFPICFGLIAVSHDFIPIFMGESFIKSATLVNYLTITIIFISFANVIRKQYLVPMEYDSIFTFSVVLGAFINLLINFLLIPKFASIGACIGTIIAEIVVMLYQVIAVRKELPIKEYIFQIIPFFIKGVIMFVIVYLIKFIGLPAIYTIVLQVVLGVVIYCLLNIKYINSIIDIKKILKKFTRKEIQ